MIIGILQCDSVATELQPAFGDYPDMIRHLLQPVNPALKLIVYDAVSGRLPSDVNECDGYITTGSHYGVNDNVGWIQPLEHFVQDLYTAQKKLVGICFGHQLMAKALGGCVERSPSGWGIGVSRTPIVGHKAWMEPFTEEINIVVSHQDQVTTPPKEAAVLAASDFCPFFMLACQDHFLSIQGHPEFSKDYSRVLCEQPDDDLPAERIRQAQVSHDLPVDDTLIAQWINHFFHD